MLNLFFKLFVLLLVLTISHKSAAFAKNDIQYRQSNSIDCSPELRNSVMVLLKLQEIRDLITTIQQEGPIRIMMNNNSYLSQEFGAFWDGENRIIFVNFGQNRTQEDVLGSIIFELHNALANSKIRHLDDLASMGRIDRDSYVEGIERIEYENSLMASALAKKGIDLGILPVKAQLPTYRSFEIHFQMQKIGGHSDWIARNYDELAPRQLTARSSKPSSLKVL